MAELGNHHSSFPSSDFNSVNDGFVAGPFGTSETGTITEFHLYCAAVSGTTVLRPLLYAADGSDPGALLSTVAEQTITTTVGWKDWTGLSVAFTAPLYIGWWQGGGGANTLYYYNSTGPGFYKSALATYHATNPAPDPWPKASDSATSSQSIAMYVVYTAGSSPQIITLTQPSETDTSQTPTSAKALAAAQTTETDTPQALTRLKTLAAAQTSETDEAQVLSRYSNIPRLRVVRSNLINI